MGVNIVNFKENSLVEGLMLKVRESYRGRISGVRRKKNQWNDDIL